ncbi:MAG: hypothetical protein MZU97_02950 [Bacillus subtilis]|nr:hypothetical protein [Bacillus subtilis]
MNSLCITEKKQEEPVTILIDSKCDNTLEFELVQENNHQSPAQRQEILIGGYSKAQGYYIGYKLTLAIEYPSLKTVVFPPSSRFTA